MNNNMPTQNTEKTPTQSVVTQKNTSIIFRFLSGAAVGLIVVSIPLSAAGLPLTRWQTVASSVVILFCGVLGLALGERFYNSIMQVLENIGS